MVKTIAVKGRSFFWLTFSLRFSIVGALSENIDLSGTFSRQLAEITYRPDDSHRYYGIAKMVHIYVFNFFSYYYSVPVNFRRSRLPTWPHSRSRLSSHHDPIGSSCLRLRMRRCLFSSHDDPPPSPLSFILFSCVIIFLCKKGWQNFGDCDFAGISRAPVLLTLRNHWGCLNFFFSHARLASFPWFPFCTELINLISILLTVIFGSWWEFTEGKDRWLKLCKESIESRRCYTFFMWGARSCIFVISF